MKINGAGKAYNTITDTQGKKATIPVYSANTSEVKIDGAGKAYINITDENGKEGIAPVVSLLEVNEGNNDLIAGTGINLISNTDINRDILSSWRPYGNLGSGILTQMRGDS